MQLIFIRHWITHSNVNKIVNGHFDDKLLDEWIVMAENLGKKLQEINVDALFASDLSRTRITAETIKTFAKRQNQIILDSKLRERFHGKYEWLPEEVMTEDRHAMGLHIGDFCELEWGELETSAQIVDRRNLFVDQYKILDFEKVCIVTHAGFIRAILSHLIGIQPSQYLNIFAPVRNCWVVVVDFDKEKDRYRIVQYEGTGW